MSEPVASDPNAAVSEEALRKAEQYIEEEEGAVNRLGGWLGVLLGTLAVAMSLFHLYTAYAIVPTQVLRPLHVSMVLAMCFLLFPASKRWRHRIMWWDWLLAALAVAKGAHILRVHDVAETVDVVRMIAAVQAAE